MLSNLNIISRGKSLLTWMVKVWKWSERVIELSGDPNYRLAIMQMLLQRDHSASAAPELWLRLERRHKKPSLSLLFLIIFPTTGLEYLLHTEALCVSPSAEAMRAKARIFFAFWRSFSWILLSCRCLSFLFTPYLYWLLPLLRWTWATDAARRDSTRVRLRSCDREVLTCHR